MKRALSLVVLTLLAAGVAASCGEQEPSVRLDPQLGRELIYEGTRADRWDDVEFGYGGELITTIRYRLTCLDSVPGRGGRYEVVVEALRVDSPPNFGIRIDTDTPEPEDEDEHRVEEFARSLLNRHAELTLGLRGEVLSAEPDPELSDTIVAWARERPRQFGRPAGILLETLLSGPRMVASWSQAAGLLFPPETNPAEGRSWTITPPPSPSHAGPLEVALIGDFSWESGTVALMHATGEFNLSTTAKGERPPVLDFDSGGIAMSARVDVDRGVLLSFTEESRFLFRKKDEARTEMPVSQHRELHLVE